MSFIIPDLGENVKRKRAIFCKCGHGNWIALNYHKKEETCYNELMNKSISSESSDGQVKKEVGAPVQEVVIEDENSEMAESLDDSAAVKPLADGEVAESPATGKKVVEEDGDDKAALSDEEVLARNELSEKRQRKDKFFDFIFNLTGNMLVYVLMAMVPLSWGWLLLWLLTLPEFAIDGGWMWMLLIMGVLALVSTGLVWLIYHFWHKNRERIRQAINDHAAAKAVYYIWLLILAAMVLYVLFWKFTAQDPLQLID